MNFLDQIVERKREALASLQPHRLRAALETPTPKLKVIAEFKRRSPSRGVIRGDLAPDAVARAYENAGACAISVLTEEDFFSGSMADVRAVRAATALPILRKDFIIDARQITDGADAILLIVAILEPKKLRALRVFIEEDLGLDALVEVHSADELQIALEAGARIVGINNRDLRTFDVSLRTSEELIAQVPDNVLAVSESGFSTNAQLRELRRLGFDAFLIGETLMRAPDPEEALRELLRDGN